MESVQTVCCVVCTQTRDRLWCGVGRFCRAELRVGLKLVAFEKEALLVPDAPSGPVPPTDNPQCYVNSAVTVLSEAVNPHNGLAASVCSLWTQHPGRLHSSSYSTSSSATSVSLYLVLPTIYQWPDCMYSCIVIDM